MVLEDEDLLSDLKDKVGECVETYYVSNVEYKNLGNDKQGNVKFDVRWESNPNNDMEFDVNLTDENGNEIIHHIGGVDEFKNDKGYNYTFTLSESDFNKIFRINVSLLYGNVVKAYKSVNFVNKNNNQKKKNELKIISASYDCYNTTVEWGIVSGYNFTLYNKTNNGWEKLCDVKNKSGTYYIPKSDEKKCGGLNCKEGTCKLNVTGKVNEINITLVQNGVEVSSSTKDVEDKCHPGNQKCNVCKEGNCMGNIPKAKNVKVYSCDVVEITKDNGKYKYKCDNRKQSVFFKGFYHLCHACGTPYIYFSNEIPDYTKISVNGIPLTKQSFFSEIDGYTDKLTRVTNNGDDCISSLPSSIKLDPNEGNHEVVDELIPELKKGKVLEMDLNEEFAGQYGTCSYTLDPGDKTYHFILDVAWKGTPKKNDGIPENCGSSYQGHYGIRVQNFFIYFDNNGKIHSTCISGDCGNVREFDITYHYNGKEINRAVFYNLKIDTSKAWTQPCLAPPSPRNGIGVVKSSDCDYSCSNEEPKVDLSVMYDGNNGEPIEKIEDGSTINVVSGRNVIFKSSQPKYKAIITVFNITKDDKPYDTISYYCVPTWSGSACPYIYTRFDYPGDYNVKANFYYAKTNSFLYTTPVIKCGQGEQHRTNVCRTTNPLWDFLENEFDINDYENPLWQQLINFITKPPETFYFKEEVPECMKICYQNGFKYIKTYQKEPVTYTKTKFKTIDFKVHAVDPKIKVLISTPTNKPKDGQIVPVKYTFHIKNGIDPSHVFAGEAFIKPLDKGVSYNNPKFYQEWIPIWSDDPIVNANDHGYEVVPDNKLSFIPVLTHESKPCSDSERESDDTSCIDVTLYAETDSICRNKDGTYNQACLSACGSDMKKCPIIFFGSYMYFNYTDPLISKNYFMPISAQDINSHQEDGPRKTYLLFYVQPQKYIPQACPGASISSLKAEKSEIDFGSQNTFDLDIEKPSGSGCYYYVMCEAKNVTRNHVYSRYMAMSGKFSDISNPIKLDSTFFKSGEWDVTCNLYSSKDGPYHTSDVLVDTKETTFEVKKPQMTGVEIHSSDIKVGENGQVSATVKSDSIDIPPEDVYFNWSLDCTNAKIIGEHEDYGLSSIVVHGDLRGSCSGELNVSYNGESIKKTFSFDVKPSDVGYNGYKKALYVIPEKTFLINAPEKMKVEAKITGYKNSERNGIVVTLSNGHDNDVQCKTDRYGRCTVSMNIRPGDTITASCKVGSDDLNGKFTVQDNADKIYFAHGYNMFSADGDVSTTCKDFSIVSVSGDKINKRGENLNLNGIYWLYTEDSNCSMSVNVNNDISKMFKGYEFYSPASQKKLIDTDFSQAFTWGHASNGWISVDSMYPGYVYVVSK